MSGNDYDSSIKTLTECIKSAALGVDRKSLDALIGLILEKRKIFIYGSGRSGLVGQYFAVRLVQMGLDVHFVGDMTTPIIKKDDLTILISNTGETMSGIQTANIARRLGSYVVSITSKPLSKLAHASNMSIILNTRSCTNDSVAPLGTLFEDSVTLMLDGIVPTLMERLGTSEDDMRKRHAIWV